MSKTVGNISFKNLPYADGSPEKILQNVLSGCRAGGMSGTHSFDKQWEVDLESQY